MLARGRTEFWSKLIEIKTDLTRGQKKKAGASAGGLDEPGGWEKTGFKFSAQSGRKREVEEEEEEGEDYTDFSRDLLLRSQGTRGLQAYARWCMVYVPPWKTNPFRGPHSSKCRG